MGDIDRGIAVFALPLALVALTAMSESAASADLGANCCADLQERVAELESTVARKGNRNVSLKLYGQVNTGVLAWDNGAQSNVYVVDNDTSSTRFGFRGEAMITSNWSAGYRIELEFQSAASDKVTESDDDQSAIGNMRQSHWYVKSKALGRFSVGLQDTANSGAAEVDLSGTNVIALSGHNSYIADIAVGNSGGVKWDTYVFGNSEFNRKNVVKYSTPTFAGLALSTAYGEDDLWDVALRYAGEVGGLKLAGAIAYGEDTDFGGSPRKEETTLGSISALHGATGLFVTGGVSYRARLTGATGRTDTKRSRTLWHVRSGLVRKWLSAGKTSVYAEYANFEGDASYSLGEDGADVYGGGLVQKIDAAAMDLYLGYRHYDLETDDIADEQIADTLMSGARIKF